MTSYEFTLQVEAATGTTFNRSGINGINTSFYLYLRGKKIRISDHYQTNQSHKQPDYNFLVWENKVQDAIDVINELLNTDPIVEMRFETPVFESTSDIVPGTYECVNFNAEIVSLNETSANVIIDGNSKVINFTYIMNWKKYVTKQIEKIIY